MKWFLIVLFAIDQTGNPTWRRAFEFPTLEACRESLREARMAETAPKVPAAIIAFCAPKIDDGIK